MLTITETETISAVLRLPEDWVWDSWIADDGDRYHLFFLKAQRALGDARLRHTAARIGHARSADMRAWELQPPISEPGAGFGELEVSQVRIVEGRPILVFTCHPDQQSAEQRSRFGRFCTWSAVGESLAGPWDLERASPFRGEPTLSAAPLVKRQDGSWVLLGFRNLEPGVPQLEVVDPLPVRLRDGRLVDLRPERG